MDEVLDEVGECVCVFCGSVGVVGLLVGCGEKCVSVLEPLEEVAELCWFLEVGVEEEGGWSDSGVVLVVEVV